RARPRDSAKGRSAIMRRPVRSWRRPFHLLTALLLVAALVAACSSPSEPSSQSQPPASEGSSSAQDPGTSATGPQATLAIEHFSVIEGTTWSGAHHRAAQRLVEKYPTVNYIYREEVGPDSTNPFAEDMIASEGASIVIGNAEFMGLPLIELADRYPDRYFGKIGRAHV